MNYHYSRQNQEGRTVFERLKEAVQGRELDVLERFGFEVVGSRNKSEVRLKNTNRDGDTGSCAFDVAKGVFFDHVDTSIKGDIIAVVAVVRGVTPIEAARLIAAEFGLDVGLDARQPVRRGRQYDRDAGPVSPEAAAQAAERASRKAQQQADDAAKTEDNKRYAQWLWEQGEPFESSPAATYIITERLGDRDLDITSDDLRFHPALNYNHEGEKLGTHPCLLAPLRNARTGEMTGVLRVYLEIWANGGVGKITLLRPGASLEDLTAADPAIRKKARLCEKKIAGVHHRSSWCHGQPTDTLIICEGVEDALSLRAATGGYVMAAGSAGQIGKADLPPGVTTVIVVPDDNKAGEDGLVRAVQTYGAQGIKVLVARLPQGEDSNSVLLKYKDHTEGNAALKAFVDAAKPYAAEDDGAEPAHEAEPAAAAAAADDDDDDDISPTQKGAPAPPADLLEIPGAYGALAKYLRDHDDYTDPVKGFMIATVGICALANGAYYFQGLKYETFTDMILVNIDASGRGKSASARQLRKIIQRVIGQHAQHNPLLTPSNLGTAPGLHDLLAKIGQKRGMTAAQFLTDEFGTELEQIANPKNPHKNAISKMMRELTHAGGEIVEPPPLSDRTNAPDRQPIPYPVIGFAGIATKDQVMRPLANNKMLADGTEARFVMLVSPLDLEFHPVAIPEPDDLVPMLKDVWGVSEGVAKSGGHGRVKPDRILVRATQGVNERIRALEYQQARDSRKLAMQASLWTALVQRRVEVIIKFAMLFAISANPTNPEVTMETLAWAERVVAFREDGHRWAREGFVDFGERATEDASTTTNLLAKARRYHDEDRRTKGYKGVSVRKLTRSFTPNLGAEQTARAINSILHQGLAKLFNRDGTELDEYPRKSAQLYLRPGRSK